MINCVSNWIFLSFLVGIPLIAYFRKVNLYQSFLCGAKEGFHTAIQIVPPIVMILVAIGMFRAASGFQIVQKFLQPSLNHLGLPTEVLPLIIVRPLSGSASIAMLTELAQQHGGAAYITHLAAILVGSTETTFYIVAIYFAAAAVYRTRYAIASGLLAGIAGVMTAIFLMRFFYT